MVSTEEGFDSAADFCSGRVVSAFGQVAFVRGYGVVFDSADCSIFARRDQEA